MIHEIKFRILLSEFTMAPTALFSFSFLELVLLLCDSFTVRDGDGGIVQYLKALKIIKDNSEIVKIHVASKAWIMGYLEHVFIQIQQIGGVSSTANGRTLPHENVNNHEKLHKTLETSGNLGGDVVETP
ncbi:hypothetical protein PHYBLDRAFT_169728 [Phycomyces blakesleeanus NRRL 1555(-)]|uniref:Uncharacterized protein n=1 Tax=Phycomyces blakesleeanus (strain ATCC 8743b / DSM 1359 / FGSC 10004 / NBRC 33097 / NRRL 1555) TaxID=763407 RepID=A0A162U608_PHYB8|nr:hypothetical protein PHYBLDRAFT_169728 [Phycomyces blakesleeanus NRRL 1555(-)]OAD72603.1 hypothetical protein PHYBLDRAFT_169728 [Phycomyces blakesleeanus NRRL 1555(-)]|eukprot:XP_018290643.1 hypothetical protein PHYBLDRAFT_169728 [Phycomyces blakesleeanus NRRL 1555(-)]